MCKYVRMYVYAYALAFTAKVITLQSPTDGVKFHSTSTYYSVPHVPIEL
jgi:hypothetical protein